jgi:hypothetical protein
VISLESELLQAHADARLIAVERREVFSIHAELRILTWGGVMLIATGIGVLVSKHLDQIGPVVIAAAIALAAAACYAFAWWKRTRTASLFDEYILLLGALLLSADVGYIESQFHLLDAHWPRHFLLLAVVHGVAAYLFGSRMVLSLSIAALAAYIGVERRVDTLFDGSVETALRAIACSALVLGWRSADVSSARHLVRTRRPHSSVTLGSWIPSFRRSLSKTRSRPSSRCAQNSSASTSARKR